MVDDIHNLIHMYKTIEKVVRFRDDNTNTWALRSGRINVFAKLEDEIELP
jgi:hypothetical protein